MSSKQTKQTRLEPSKIRTLNSTTLLLSMTSTETRFIAAMDMKMGTWWTAMQGLIILLKLTTSQTLRQWGSNWLRHWTSILISRLPNRVLKIRLYTSRCYSSIYPPRLISNLKLSHLLVFKKDRLLLLTHSAYMVTTFLKENGTVLVLEMMGSPISDQMHRFQKVHLTISTLKQTRCSWKSW